MNELGKILDVVNPSKWMPEKKNLQTAATTVVKEVTRPPKGSGFVRLAGLSGAVAVVMGAYGAHVMRPEKNLTPERITAFETGSRYHLIHSVVLLAVPLSRRPMLVGSLLTMGMTVFCGSCYYHSLTGNKKVRKATPYGGMILIAAWLSFLL